MRRPEPDDTRVCRCGHTAAWHSIKDLLTGRWLCLHCICFGFEQNHYWCNSHGRPAMNAKECDPRLAGIMIPCNVVDLTGIAEIVEEDDD